MTNYDIIIVGAGVVGCSIALEASNFRLRTAVLEKANDVAGGISKGNSGVVHAGFNVPPGTLKAKFNVEGAEMFPELCRRLEVPHLQCGKLVIARDDEELSQLVQLEEQGKTNGCRDLSIVGQDVIRRHVPSLRAKWALYSPHTGVVSPYLLTTRIAEEAYRRGVEFIFEQTVMQIRDCNEGIEVETASGTKYVSAVVVNAAGLQAAKLASDTEREPSWEVYPYRGQYLVLDSAAAQYVRVAVYPVPPKDGKGLGVHLTPTTNGAVLVGPSSELVGTNTDTSNTSEVMQSMKESAAEMIPELARIPTIKTYAGIRPKLVGPERPGGFEDFCIRASDRITGLYHLIGIESPGLTAAPAIARYLMLNIGQTLPIAPKKPSKPTKVGKRENVSSGEEIVCMCQSVSKRQILAAARNPFRAKSIAAIRKRTDAATGACQGQFCLPKIVRLLLEEERLKPAQILQDGTGSNLFRESCSR